MFSSSHNKQTNLSFFHSHQSASSFSLFTPPSNLVYLSVLTLSLSQGSFLLVVRCRVCVADCNQLLSLLLLLRSHRNFNFTFNSFSLYEVVHLRPTVERCLTEVITNHSTWMASEKVLLGGISWILNYLHLLMSELQNLDSVLIN